MLCCRRQLMNAVGHSKVAGRLCVGNIIKTSCLMMPKKRIFAVFSYYEKLACELHFQEWGWIIKTSLKHVHVFARCFSRLLTLEMETCRMWKCRACFVWSENIYIFYTQFPTHACQQFSWSDLLYVWKSSFHFVCFSFCSSNRWKSFSHFEILWITSFQMERWRML